jgi:hypothetical protein
MNRLAIFSLAIALFLSACKKDSLSTPGSEITGQLKYGGNPIADGIGYYMLEDSTHETLSLQNLPAEYRHTDVNDHIAIKFFDTGKTQNTTMLAGATGPRIVVIRSIRKL